MIIPGKANVQCTGHGVGTRARFAADQGGRRATTRCAGEEEAGRQRQGRIS